MWCARPPKERILNPTRPTRKFDVPTPVRLTVMLRYTLHRKYRVITLPLWRGQPESLSRKLPAYLASQRAPSGREFTGGHWRLREKAERYTFVLTLMIRRKNAPTKRSLSRRYASIIRR